MKMLLWGLLLTAAITVVMRLAFGPEAVVAAAAFGLLATAIQVAAVRMVTPVLDQGFARFGKRWALGMALRLVGVVMVFVAIGLDRQLFPPLPTAFGFLGVVVPLLFFEVRFVR